MIIDSKCKKCRRAGEKLFLKGERCNTPKCAMVRKPYPPGEKSKRRRGGISEYGKELREKQKLKNWYNLTEKQFYNYVKSAMAKRGEEVDAGEVLLRKMESRLDNTVYRFGFASSRRQARQMISHGLFLINGRKVNIPSYLLKEGDIIKIDPQKKDKKIFQGLSEKLKNHQTPSWLFLDLKKMEGKVGGQPLVEEITPPVQISSIFEYYSR